MAVDLGTVLMLGGVVQVVANMVTIYLRHEPVSVTGMQPLLALGGPAVVLLLLVPLVGNGATIGQRTVLLQPLDAIVRKPSVVRMLVRFATGSGGFFALVCWALLGESNQPLAAAAVLLLVSGLIALWPQDHRGLSGLLSGVWLADTRVALSATNLAEDHPSRPNIPVAEEQR
jgi:hypothetical protein